MADRVRFWSDTSLSDFADALRDADIPFDDSETGVLAVDLTPELRDLARDLGADVLPGR